MTTTNDTGSGARVPSQAVTRSKALAVVAASHRTGDTLPRYVYKLAGVKVPSNATDELQTRHRS